jgi:hypothetical protein
MRVTVGVPGTGLSYSTKLERRYRWGGRACPHCAQRVSRQALICRHCRSGLPPVPFIERKRALVAVVVIILLMGSLSVAKYLDRAPPVAKIEAIKAPALAPAQASASEQSAPVLPLARATASAESAPVRESVPLPRPAPKRTP